MIASASGPLSPAHRPTVLLPARASLQLGLPRSGPVSEQRRAARLPRPTPAPRRRVSDHLPQPTAPNASPLSQGASSGPGAREAEAGGRAHGSPGPQKKEKKAQCIKLQAGKSLTHFLPPLPPLFFLSKAITNLFPFPVPKANYVIYRVWVLLWDRLQSCFTSCPLLGVPPTPQAGVSQGQGLLPLPSVTSVLGSGRRNP